MYTTSSNDFDLSRICRVKKSCNERTYWRASHSTWLLLLIFINSVPAQESEFVIRSGSNLLLADKPFYPVGVNCYFLQNLAAYGDTVHIDEIFQEAKQLGVTTIRTWGFFDNPDSTNVAVIQHSPGRFIERGLQALDLIIAKAKEYSIRLIIPFVNNWEDYGGMNQYVQWFAEIFSAKNIQSSFTKQRIIYGAEGRSYRFHVSNMLTHDDFYTNSTIKQWYRNYLSMMLNRTNIITNTKYRDEPIILAWELANEARSSDRTGTIVSNWMNEMSTFIKSIDGNHLISTGDEGFDVSSTNYGNIDLFNDQIWLFDGTGGSSFQSNLSLPNVDIGSIHCYPESWKLDGNSGTCWLTSHNRIANGLQKPLVLGEIGKRYQQQIFYNVLFNEAFTSNSSGILIWQFVYDGRFNNDGFAFTYPADGTICDILKLYASRFVQRSLGTCILPQYTNLLSNYPNPFNTVSLIPYNLASSTGVRIDVYDGAGRQITSLVSQHQTAGYHLTIFDGAGLSSGTYFIRLVTDELICTKKVLLLR